jgi:hypothetical protein
MVPVVAVVLAQETVHHHILMHVKAVMPQPILAAVVEVEADSVDLADLADLVL